MKTLQDYTEAIDALRQAHLHYRAALLPHPDHDENVTYAEYDEAMNEALEDLEAAVASILSDFDKPRLGE